MGFIFGLITGSTRRIDNANQLLPLSKQNGFYLVWGVWLTICAASLIAIFINYKRNHN